MILSHNQNRELATYHMQKYLIEVKETHSDNTALLQITADSPEEAVKAVESSWEVLRVRKPWGGRRDGAGRVSVWGKGVETHRYRLPVPFGSNAEEIGVNIGFLIPGAKPD